MSVPVNYDVHVFRDRDARWGARCEADGIMVRVTGHFLPREAFAAAFNEHGARWVAREREHQQKQQPYG